MACRNVRFRQLIGQVATPSLGDVQDIREVVAESQEHHTRGELGIASTRCALSCRAYEACKEFRPMLITGADTRCGNVRVT
jgi:hypothetical protein